MSNHEPLLTSREQYISELKRFPLLSKEEQRTLEECVRQGNEEARERLIIECMHFVEHTASLYARTYLRYDEYLDLVQVGNLALLEHVHKILSPGKSIGYLCAIARRIMRYYCLYRSQLITLPMGEALPKERPTIISIQELISLHDETWMQLNHLITEMGGELPEDVNTHKSLQQALEILSEKEREVVVRHHGLDGGVAETLVDIGKQLPVKPGSNAAYVRYYRALKRLRTQLEQA
jgi:RNA polymerase sigma factor (sigma-70 family)